MEKRYDFRTAEKETQDFWEREQIYKFNPQAEGEVYSIDTPPPTVSGSPHVGHLFSYTQAEIVARYRRMRRYNVFYPFGFDDNGLPTERLVEREEKIRARDLPRGEFVARCRATAQKYEAEFKAFWQSLGFSVDWSLQYETVGAEAQALSQRLFLELAEREKAYAKESPVLWCTECGTSIAQAELETKDRASAFHYIPFMVGDTPLPVATTRPELLYGCVCLFVHPEDERYRAFVGRTAAVPLYGYEIPILTDEKADPAKGTGAVMCATFGDSADAAWFAEHRLPHRRVLLPDGTVAPDVPFIGGLSVPAARKETVRLLAEAGLLIKSETVTHAVAVHERCGTEVEILLSRQWYIDILSEKARYLAAADEINWHPAHMKNRYIAWVENLKWDWCVSRQRFFGVPFPVWYCKSCGKPAFAAPEQLPVNPPETSYTGACACGCTEFVPETAVLDTWATSSVTPQINELSGIKLTPMSMRAHAHEIIRTWTFYSVVRSLYHTGGIPWKDLMISGFVLAKDGEKLSKSKDNSKLSPTALIAEHSADVLRYWSTGANLGSDIFFDEKELAVPKRFITKLWNAARFVIGRLDDMDFPCAPELPPIDRWILARADEVTANAAALLDSYEIGPARHGIDEFFWRDFCDNYIELAKARLYEDGGSGRRAAQFASYRALLRILKLYAPYVPHITEVIYRAFFIKYEKIKSVHLLQWETAGNPDPNLLQFGREFQTALTEMRRYKSERSLSLRAETENWPITCSPEFLPWFEQSEADLKACANARRIELIISARSHK